MRSRRRSMAALATVLAVSGVGVATTANYVDVETTPQNRFTAGTLDLTASPQSEAWRVTNMAPGDEEYRVITVGSAGSLPLSYSASATLADTTDTATKTNPNSPPNSGGLGEALRMRYRGVVNSAADCSASAGSPPALVSEDSDFAVSVPQAVDLGSPTRRLEAGTSEFLCFSALLPITADNRYQGDAANFTLSFSGTQTSRTAVTDTSAGVAAMQVAATPADKAIALSWSPVAAATGGYKVNVTPASSGTNVRSVSAGGNSVNFTGLENGTSYKFTVRGYAADGSLVTVGSSSMVTAGLFAPDAPGNLIATPAAGGGVTAGWTAPVTDAVHPAVTNYTVQLLQGATVVATQSVPAGTTTANFTNLSSGGSYSLSVTASNVIGTSAAATVTAAAGGYIPQPVTNLTGASVNGGGIAAAWTAPTSDATHDAVTNYTVQLLQGATVVATQSVPAGTTTANFTNLSSGGSYSLSVTASNTAGSAAPVTTIAAAGSYVPNAVTNLNSSPVSGGGLTASWSAPISDVTHDVATSYTVKLMTSGSSPSVISTQTITGTTTQFTGLTSGGGYTISVAAVNPVGSAAPVSKLVTAGGYSPDAVTNLTAVSSQSTVTASWTAPSASANKDSASGYTVKLMSGTAVVSSKNVTGTSTSFSSVTNGTYTVSVMATNVSGSGVETTAPVVVAAAPNAPTNVTADRTSTSSALVNWTASSTTTVTGYKVSRSGSAGGPWFDLGTTPSRTSTSYTDNNSGNSSVWYYRVVAVDNGVISPDAVSGGVAVISTPGTATITSFRSFPNPAFIGIYASIPGELNGNSNVSWRAQSAQNCSGLGGWTDARYSTSPDGSGFFTVPLEDKAGNCYRLAAVDRGLQGNWAYATR